MVKVTNKVREINLLLLEQFVLVAVSEKVPLPSAGKVWKINNSLCSGAIFNIVIIVLRSAELHKSTMFPLFLPFLISSVSDCHIRMITSFHPFLSSSFHHLLSLPTPDK